ncbi:hypothetical protein GCM10022227_05640 [Streptomyces sedi]
MLNDGLSVFVGQFVVGHHTPPTVTPGELVEDSARINGCSPSPRPDITNVLVWFQKGCASVTVRLGEDGLDELGDPGGGASQFAKEPPGLEGGDGLFDKGPDLRMGPVHRLLACGEVLLSSPARDADRPVEVHGAVEEARHRLVVGDRVTLPHLQCNGDRAGAPRPTWGKREAADESACTPGPVPGACPKVRAGWRSSI